MRIIDRLDKYMVIKKINDNQITVNCGLSVGLLGKARRGASDLGHKSINRILSFYQDINRVWLLTGEGEMLKNTVVNVGDACKADTTVVVEIDLVSEKASASFVNSFYDDRECNFDRIPVIPANGEQLNAGSYKVFEVLGDSMLPTISTGALVLAKELEEGKWEYAEGVVVVVFSEMVVIKRIARNDLYRNNLLTLSSDNVKYGEMTIPREDIRAIYRAKRKISENIF